MLAMLIAAALPFQPPLVPGGCTEPAAEHVGQPGCYLLAEFTIQRPPAELFWHVVRFDDAQDAEREARRHRWGRAVTAHGANWLLFMGRKKEAAASGAPVQVVGPMQVPKGGAASIRFLISDFPPRMRTRVHAHPGSEAFYVVSGEQCVETPSKRHRIERGESYVVPGGPHMQAAPQGRKSLVALVLRPGESWSQHVSSWQPSAFCDR